MLVVKRDGKSEPVAFDKITARIKKLCYGFDPKHVDPALVAQKVVAGVYDGVTTVALDDLASETSAFLTTQHPDYGRLAARIAVSNLHKQTEKSFTKTMSDMYSYVDPRTQEPAPLISDKLRDLIVAHGDRLNAAIVYDRDFDYDFFGFKTLERSYLLKMVRARRSREPTRESQLLHHPHAKWGGGHPCDLPRIVHPMAPPHPAPPLPPPLCSLSLALNR